MISVEQRIKQITQPKGGYLSSQQFDIITLENHHALHACENISKKLIGLAVDYLTQVQTGVPVEEAFKVSLIGAHLVGEDAFAQQYAEQIRGLDTDSIFYACKLVGYDVCFRTSVLSYKPVHLICADQYTIENIYHMVNRSLAFIQTYGSVTKRRITFDGGYTDFISAGYGDFLTKETLWDFKVSTKSPTNSHALQLLIYYLMGLRSIYHVNFETIQNLGIFNPRLNCVYLMKIEDIPKNVINEVSEKVIGYFE